MGYIVNNDSMEFRGKITSGLTINDWKRAMYEIDGTTGGFTVTLPAFPTTTNLVESGSIYFRRVDGVWANKVYVVVNINGFPTNVEIPAYFNGYYRFYSVLDPTGTSTLTCGYNAVLQDTSNGAERVAKFPVSTIATTNMDVAANNYIGMVINGVTLAAGSTILLSAQTNATQNGVVNVTNTGNIVKRQDFFTGIDLRNYIVPVAGGTFAGNVYILSSAVDQYGACPSGLVNINVDLYVEGQNPLLINDYEKFTQILDQDYTAFPTDTIIICNLVSGVNRTLTLPKLSLLLNPSTTGLLKIYQIFKLAPSGVLTVSCTSGDTFGDGTTSTTLQKNGDNIYLTGIISPTNSFWLIG